MGIGDICLQPSGKTSGKTAGKTSGKTSGKTTGTGDLKLTAAEKRLVKLYREADADTKKAAMNLLSGKGGASAVLNSIMATLGDSGISNLSGKNEALGTILEMLGKIK